MVRTRRASSQEQVEGGLARVLDFDNVDEDMDPRRISEALVDTIQEETKSQHDQPEICGGDCEYGDEKQGSQVIQLEQILSFRK